MSATGRAAAIAREADAARFIPYSAHVSDRVVKTVNGHYVQVFRLGGASFQSADDVELNVLHERLNVLWRNIASPQVALWTHVIRRREAVAPAPQPATGFAVALERRYKERLCAETLMSNELYLALVYRPVVHAPRGLLARLIERTAREDASLAQRDALDACDKLSQTVRAALQHYEPEALDTYWASGRCYSRVLEFFSLLINAEPCRVPLPLAPLHDVLATSRVLFGGEALEYRAAAQSRVAAVLGIKEYGTPTTIGMYDRLLSAPFGFVLTQSFTFLTKSAGQGLLQRQFNRMANAGDFALTQARQLKDALDALTSNDFVMGDHHLSLQVISEPLEGVTPEASVRRLRGLNDSVALARTLLADAGVIVAREDLAMEAAFWAQLPGQFGLRPRKAPLTSRNFAGMAPLHNFPVGRRADNHWGEALALLITSAQSGYHFSLHASDPREPDGGSRRDTGHTFICGPTGSGKTVFIGFIMCMLSLRSVTQVVIDKDRGLELLVRALGGEYLPLRNGEPTGFNPLQLPSTADNHEFLKAWLRVLARPPHGGALGTREQADLDQALRGTLTLEPSARRLSRLLEFLDPTDPEGTYARLSPWCEAARGDYAWVFDNPDDTVVGRLAGRPVIGFDVTDFLSNATTRTPITLYLFHLVRQLLDGRRLVCWMDEFWRLLEDAAFEGFAKDGPKTWRKLNAVMCLATQSASDVLHSGISRTVVEQTPTKIFFPNIDATANDYVGGLGLSEREFKLIRDELEPGSRRFLVRQGHRSVVCQLDLKGFDAELAVISGRSSSLARMRRIMAEVGSATDQWLPIFLQQGDDA